MRNLLKKIPPPALLVLLGALLGALFSLFRLLHAWLNWAHVSATPGFARLFLIGARVDLMSASYFLLPPALALLFFPRATARWPRAFAAYFAAVFAACAFLEFATIPFIDEYGLRPNRIFIEYLVNIKEVSLTLVRMTPGYLAGGAALLAAAWFGLRRLFTPLFRDAPQLAGRRRVAALPLLIAALAFGARGSGPWDPKPVTIGVAEFSADHLTNQLALNSAYSLLWAARAMKFEKNPAGVYRATMAPEEIYSLVRAASGIPARQFISGEIPLLHRQPARVRREPPLNLVVVLEESMGAEFVGSLGGLPLTPNFDRLGEEGLLLTRLYSTGTRSINGIEAVLSGFLPTPGKGVVKLGLAQHGFFTVADLLGRRGYDTAFIYGGDSNFDTMRSFAIGNGFGNVIDQRDFRDPEFTATWGVSDEDLFKNANGWLRARTRPAFALIFTTSNHGPFEFPDGRIKLYSEPKASRYNAVKYADYALGRFFELAKKERYFKNTVFLVVADHNWRSGGEGLVPLQKMRVPGLIMGPGFKPAVHARPASQIDLMPTILPALGLDLEHPMIGRDLLALPGDYPGRAVLQFGGNNGYLLGDRLLVTMPDDIRHEFLVKDGKFIPRPVDPALERVALAHALLPGQLYLARKHRLP